MATKVNTDGSQRVALAVRRCSNLACTLPPRDDALPLPALRCGRSGSADRRHHVTKLELDESGGGADESENMNPEGKKHSPLRECTFGVSAPAGASLCSLLQAKAGKPHRHFFLFGPLSSCNSPLYPKQLRDCFGPPGRDRRPRCRREQSERWGLATLRPDSPRLSRTFITIYARSTCASRNTHTRRPAFGGPLTAPSRGRVTLLLAARGKASCYSVGFATVGRLRGHSRRAVAR